METNPNPADDHQGSEALIQSFLDQGYGVGTDLFAAETLQGMQSNLLDLLAQGQLKPAGVGRQEGYLHDRSVRSDLIRWIEPESDNPFERAFCQELETFIAYLNRTCYTGINGYEIHYACYQPGTFYKKHKDQFQSDLGRQFSIITYLNEEWKASEGGALTLFLPTGEVSLLPVMGQTVFFRSNEIPHEVTTAHRIRLSITGWLKRN